MLPGCAYAVDLAFFWIEFHLPSVIWIPILPVHQDYAVKPLYNYESSGNNLVSDEVHTGRSLMEARNNSGPKKVP